MGRFRSITCRALPLVGRATAVRAGGVAGHEGVVHDHGTPPLQLPDEQPATTVLHGRRVSVEVGRGGH